MSSPTTRTLKLLRDLGWTVGIVERWIPQARKRSDLWGFADLAALHPAHQSVLLVQTTSASNHAARRAKLLALPTVALAKQAGCMVQIISWAVRKPRGTKVRRWTARIEAL